MLDAKLNLHEQSLHCKFVYFCRAEVALCWAFMTLQLWTPRRKDSLSLAGRLDF